MRGESEDVEGGDVFEVEGGGVEHLPEEVAPQAVAVAGLEQEDDDHAGQEAADVGEEGDAAALRADVCDGADSR